MALLLCLDSSTPCGSVALCQNDRVLAEITLDVSAKTHSDYLLRYSDLLLSEVGLSLHALDGFGVVVGPGSFTGLRVGLATVQGLALAGEQPVYPVSSLDVIAFAAGPSELPVVAVIDARKKEVYAACYRWRRGLPQRQCQEQVVAPQLLVNSLDEKTLFVGNGIGRYPQYFTQTNERIVISADVNMVPKAGAAGLLIAHPQSRVDAVDPFHLHPVYIRPSDAEIQQSSRVG